MIFRMVDRGDSSLGDHVSLILHSVNVVTVFSPENTHCNMSRMFPGWLRFTHIVMSILRTKYRHYLDLRLLNAIWVNHIHPGNIICGLQKKIYNIRRMHTGRRRLRDVWLISKSRTFCVILLLWEFLWMLTFLTVLNGKQYYNILRVFIIIWGKTVWNIF